MVSQNSAAIQPMRVKTRLRHYHWWRILDLCLWSRFQAAFDLCVFQDDLKSISAPGALQWQLLPVFGKRVALLPLSLTIAKQLGNTDWYTIEKLVVTEFRKKFKTPYENASSHNAGETTGFLKKQTLEILDHLPYSLNLIPNDFFTFRKFKQSLHG